VHINYSPALAHPWCCLFGLKLRRNTDQNQKFLLTHKLMTHAGLKEPVVRPQFAENASCCGNGGGGEGGGRGGGGLTDSSGQVCSTLTRPHCHGATLVSATRSLTVRDCGFARAAEMIGHSSPTEASPNCLGHSGGWAGGSGPEHCY